MIGQTVAPVLAQHHCGELEASSTGDCTPCGFHGAGCLPAFLPALYRNRRFLPTAYPRGRPALWPTESPVLTPSPHGSMLIFLPPDLKLVNPFLLCSSSPAASAKVKSERNCEIHGPQGCDLLGSEFQSSHYQEKQRPKNLLITWIEYTLLSFMYIKEM